MTEKTSMQLLQEYAQKDVLVSSLSKIVNTNNVEGLKQLISSNTFTALSREEVESTAFRFAFFRFDNLSENKLLKYLIIDYGIKKEVSIDLIKGSEVSPFVKHLFDIRNLKEELSSELDNNEKNNKRLKI